MLSEAGRGLGGRLPFLRASGAEKGLSTEARISYAMVDRADDEDHVNLTCDVSEAVAFSAVEKKPP